ncbi:MAG: (2Fe-2S)-binding protein [Acidimicrobiales bacterium]|jgi:aerobic carbon-monoxide dehydrogenase small subunit
MTQPVSPDPQQWQINFRVDGRVICSTVEPRLSLADHLREDLGVTAVRVGCEQGVCGSCTVMLDGVSARACCTLAVQVDGAEVETVVGLADELEAVRAAFTRNFAIQCGFCASGVLVTAAEFLRTHPTATESEIRAMLSGTICRCTGYEGMVQALLELASG